MFKVETPLVLWWANVDPATRCLLLAEAVPVFTMMEDGDDGPIAGWSEVAMKILEIAPDKSAFLGVLATRFRPNGWSGSLADIYEDRRKLPQALFEHPDNSVRTWAEKQDRELAEWVEQERQRERGRDESFE